jgi:hypothetical protein
MKDYYSSIAPVPFTHIPKVVEFVVEKGWSYVDGFQIGLMVPKKSILAGINGDQSQAIPACFIFLC